MTAMAASRSPATSIPVRGGGPRYGASEALLALALRLQGSSTGLTFGEIAEFLKEMGRPHGRRTIERMRDALERLCPDFGPIDPQERPLRFRIGGRGPAMASLVPIEAKDIVALGTAARTLERENQIDHARTLDRIALLLMSQMDAGRKRRLEPDIELLSQAEGIALRPGPRVIVPPERLNDIRAAILGFRRLRLRYKSRGTGLSSTQIVEPYAMVYGHRPYLLAWNTELRKYSYWALTGIQSLELLDATFKRRKFLLRKYLERSFGVFQEKPFKVVWRFDADVADEAAQFQFHPTQKMKRLKDGRLEVRFTAGGRREMEWHLATWGDGVEAVNGYLTSSDRNRRNIKR